MRNTLSMVRRAAATALLALATSCAMPASVTSLKDVQKASAQGEITLIPVTAATLPETSAPIRAGFPAEFTGAKEFDYDKLGPGDRVAVRMFESGTATVFTGPGGSMDLGELTVDEAGVLSLPYVGALKVAGMTIPQVRDAAEKKLRRVVLGPQVDIRALDRRSMLVSVQGDAAKTGSFTIERGRTRLGALLAEVAPSQKIPEMLDVTVRRGSASGTERLSDIYRTPGLDIALRPGDSVIVSEVVQNVTVLGAAGVQGQVRVTKRGFSLLDAIGQARGLSEEAADPRAVFLMRAAPEAGAPPIAYQIDMRRPEAIALANRFVLRDGDAILISNAPFAQTRKILGAFGQSLSTLRSAVAVPIP